MITRRFRIVGTSATLESNLDKDRC